MKKYVRWINNYYVIGDNLAIGIVYEKGNGISVDLQISSRRVRKIENVEGLSCSIIIIKENAGPEEVENTIIYFEEYKFENKDNKCFLNLSRILDNIGIKYEQLDSKKYQKVKSIDDSINLYNKGILDTYMLGGDLYMYGVGAVYLPQEMYIGNREVYEINVLSCYKEDSLYQNVLESIERGEKVDITIDDDFIKDFFLCEIVDIRFQGGNIHKDRFPDINKMSLYFEESDKEINILFNNNCRQITTVLNAFIRCKSYERIVNTYYKMKMLGVSDGFNILGIEK